MLYLIYAIVAVVIIIIANALFYKQEQVSIIKVSKRLDLTKFFVFLLNPLNVLNFGLLKAFPVINNHLQKKISFVKWHILPVSFFSFKEFVAVLLAAGLYFLVPNLALIWIFIAAAIGFFMPDFILRSKVNNKRYSIVKVLPETVDLLSLCVSAGLDFMASVRWITAKAHTNPMIEEFKDLMEEIKMGRPKTEALKQISKRLDIPEVSSFIRSIIQAERMGTSVEETFNIISEDMRIRRTYRGEREAVKASLKMLIPLIIFILPIILIVVAGPVLLEFVKGGITGMVK